MPCNFTFILFYYFYFYNVLLCTLESYLLTTLFPKSTFILFLLIFISSHIRLRILCIRLSSSVSFSRFGATISFVPFMQILMVTSKATSYRLTLVPSYVDDPASFIPLFPRLLSSSVSAILFLLALLWN